MFTAAQVEEPFDRRAYIIRVAASSRSKTHNMGGGSICPLAQLQAICAMEHRYELMTYLDGGRLLNAVVATAIPARTYAEPFDSAWIDLSKGLGCPVGAVLAGSQAFIKDTRRHKHLFGGAMRQAGIIAAAEVYALEHHVARLAEDHVHATMLAQSLAALPAVSLNPRDFETKIIIFNVGAGGRGAKEIDERVEKAGVRLSVLGRTKLRAVTRLDISRPNVEPAFEVFRHVL
jgi:threonine aldolase